MKSKRNDLKSILKLVAVDVDGTFVHSDYTYDTERFQYLLSRMKEAGCSFVVASGNQYYQLRDLFPGYYDELSFVAENGAFVKDRRELVFTADMPRETVAAAIDLCREYPEISNVLCGVESAYCQRGSVTQEFFDLTGIYYHRLKWVEDLKQVTDKILKFAPTVPEEQTDFYYNLFRDRLHGKAEPVTSGHGSIDLIVPGCHKASGIRRLVKRWALSPGPVCRLRRRRKRCGNAALLPIQLCHGERTGLCQKGGSRHLSFQRGGRRTGHPGSDFRIAVSPLVLIC